MVRVFSLTISHVFCSEFECYESAMVNKKIHCKRKLIYIFYITFLLSFKLCNPWLVRISNLKYKLFLKMYSFQGGLKGVVWTDVIQIIIMFGSILLVVIKGTLDIGGIGNVLERNLQSSRLEGPKLVKKIMNLK